MNATGVSARAVQATEFIVSEDSRAKPGAEAGSYRALICEGGGRFYFFAWKRGLSRRSRM
jgi:hypothetical protein